MARAGDAEARVGDGAVARAGDARASIRGAVASGEEKMERDDHSEDRPRKVTLKVAGDQGTAFSGVCTVDGHEDAIEGRTPARYKYEPGDGKLECEIRKEGAGALEIAITGESVDSVQQTDAQRSIVRFAFSEGRVSSSSSSVSMSQTIEFSNQSFANDF
jgi:hypothetical protein